MTLLLRNKKVELHLMTRQDAAAFLALADDVTAMSAHWMLNEVMTPTALEKRLAEDGYYAPDRGRLLLRVPGDDAIVGQMIFFKPVAHWEALEIGYRIFDAKRQGQGLATAATRLLASFLFESRRVERLQICADPDNVAANKVAAKAGFTCEGVLRAPLFCRGKQANLAIHSLLRAEAPPLSSLLD